MWYGMVKNVVELECNKNVKNALLVLILTCTTWCSVTYRSDQNMFHFLICIYFWCYFSWKLKQKKLLGSRSESKVSNNERPPIQLATGKGSSGSTATGLAVASRGLHVAPGQHQCSSQPTPKQGIEYGGGHWSVLCYCTPTTRKHRRSSGPFYASPPATSFMTSLHSHLCALAVHVQVRTPVSLTSGFRFGSIWTSQVLGYGVCWHV
jgi:hypothetical protein